MAEDPPVIPLSRISGLHRALRPAERLLAILDDKDPPARVAAMPVLDLYFLIKELGHDEGSDLVALATPDQVQGFMDLESWKGDKLVEAGVRPWLASLLEAGPEKLTEVWRGLDPELTALLLARWTRIYQLAEEELPDWEEPPFFPTPDRFFMVKIVVEDDETVRLIERLLDYLYRVDAVLARHTLRAAASEPTTDLEETSYRWRSGRMQDLGYADPAEAAVVYAPIDVTGVRIGEASEDRLVENTALPALFSEPTLKQPFLRKVLGQVVEADEARRLESALVGLLNRVLAADHVAPGEIDAATAAATRAAATLSLGLETIARGDVEKGVQALRTIALVRLHRVGVTTTAQLQKLARLLGTRGAHSDEPFPSMLAALVGPRPLVSRVLDTPPGVGTRPFATLADVSLVASELARLAAQLMIVHELLGADPEKLPGTTLGTLGRTAIARKALGLPAHALPLPPKELPRLLGQRLPADEIQKYFRELAVQHGFSPGPEFAAAILGWIGDLEQNLSALDPSAAVESRYLQGVLLLGDSHE